MPFPLQRVASPMKSYTSFKTPDPNPLRYAACLLSRWNPYPPRPHSLPPALPPQKLPLPHIVHLSCKGFGGRFPLSSALAAPRLTGSASRDARPSSEAPGSGQCRPTSCRDNVTVTFRVCLSPMVPSPPPVRLHFTGREPEAKGEVTHSKSSWQGSEGQD